MCDKSFVSLFFFGLKKSHFRYITVAGSVFLDFEKEKLQQKEEKEKTTALSTRTRTRGTVYLDDPYIYWEYRHSLISPPRHEN